MSSSNLIRNLRKQWPVGPGNRVICATMDEAADKIEELEAKLAEYEKQKPIGFVKALEVAEGAFNSWETKTHNFKWAKRLEGTPITNDVTVAMAQYFSRYYTSPAPMEEKK